MMVTMTGIAMLINYDNELYTSTFTAITVLVMSSWMTVFRFILSPRIDIIESDRNYSTVT